MDEMDSIKKDIEEIKERNRRVEADKAWEISAFRKILIAVITYIIASLALKVSGTSEYFKGALIPTIGYLLSTLSLPYIKNWWISKLG